jgi:hypothetical protein
MGEVCSRYQEGNIVLVGKLEGKRLIGTYKRRGDDDIENYVTEEGVRTWTGYRWLKISIGS